MAVHVTVCVTGAGLVGAAMLRIVIHGVTVLDTRRGGVNLRQSRHALGVALTYPGMSITPERVACAPGASPSMPRDAHPPRWARRRVDRRAPVG